MAYIRITFFLGIIFGVLACSVPPVWAQGVSGASCTGGAGTPTTKCSGTINTSAYVIPEKCRTQAPSTTSPCSDFQGSYADPTTNHAGEVHTLIYKQQDGTFLVKFNEASITLTADGKIIKDTTATNEDPNNPHRCDTGSRPYYEILDPATGKPGAPFVPTSMTCGKNIDSAARLVGHAPNGAVCNTNYDGDIGTTRQLIYQGPGTCNGQTVEDAIVVASTGGAGAGEVYVYCKGLGLCAVYGQMGNPNASGWGQGTDLCNLSIQSACTVVGDPGRAGRSPLTVTSSETFTGKNVPLARIQKVNNASFPEKFQEIDEHLSNAFDPNTGSAVIGGAIVNGAKLIPAGLQKNVTYQIGDLHEIHAIGGVTQNISGKGNTPCEYSDEATETDALPAEYGRTRGHVGTLNSVFGLDSSDLKTIISQPHIVDSQGDRRLLTSEYKTQLLPCGDQRSKGKVSAIKVTSHGSIFGDISAFIKNFLGGIIGLFTDESENTATTTQTLTAFTPHMEDIAEKSVGKQGAFHSFRPSAIDFSGVDGCTNPDAVDCPENTTDSIPHFQVQAFENAYDKVTKCALLPTEQQTSDCKTTKGTVEESQQPTTPPVSSAACEQLIRSFKSADTSCKLCNIPKIANLVDDRNSLVGGTLPPLMVSMLEKAAETYSVPASVILSVMYHEGGFSGGRYVDANAWTDANIIKWSCSQEPMPRCDNNADRTQPPFGWLKVYWPDNSDAVRSVDPTRSNPSRCNFMDALFATAKALHRWSGARGGYTQGLAACHGNSFEDKMPNSCSGWNKNTVMQSKAGYGGYCPGEGSYPRSNPSFPADADFIELGIKYFGTFSCR